MNGVQAVTPKSLKTKQDLIGGSFFRERFGKSCGDPVALILNKCSSIDQVLTILNHVGLEVPEKLRTMRRAVARMIAGNMLRAYCRKRSLFTTREVYAAFGISND